MLTHHDPFSRSVELLQDTLRSVLGEPMSSLEASRATGWVPPVDVYEDPERITFKFEIPEVCKQDLSVRIENGVLTVEGTRKLEFEELRANYHRIERPFGRFARSFSLPTTVATEKIDAELKDGILRLTLTKKPEAQSRTIEIK
jgi:HSP20 family protein